MPVHERIKPLTQVRADPGTQLLPRLPPHRRRRRLHNLPAVLLASLLACMLASIPVRSVDALRPSEQVILPAHDDTR